MSVKTQRSPTHVPPVIHRYGLQSTTLASVAAGPPPASLLAIKRSLREQTRLQPVRRPSPASTPSSPPARPSTSTPLLRVSALAAERPRTSEAAHHTRQRSPSSASKPAVRPPPLGLRRSLSLAAALGRGRGGAPPPGEAGGASAVASAAGSGRVVVCQFTLYHGTHNT